ncbi:uncharacterized protein GIQ15_00958 [Arthroderma uncinatum]|uniref:uncharacterized protein n=1 Tax=Arthroderma uncinatum TaxID=74035 RepID=UPI00144A6CC4|nr:uncharacterized protein GIQ15_00958 [Arthroderma uncinatum]KAF3491441.1 hypothetical protein GIQ15_00958 [Arthroderma uncinatum]
MARTRSQPMSPSGYQIWETPRRTRRTATEATEAAPAPKPAAKATKAPKAATTRVNKSKAKKGKKPAPKKRLPGSYDDDEDDEREEAPAAESSTSNSNGNEAVNTAVNNNNNNSNSNDRGNAAGNDNNTVTAPTTPSHPTPTPTPQVQVQVLVPSPLQANGPPSSRSTPSTPAQAPASQTAARNTDALHVSPVVETTANVENNENIRTSINNGNQALSQSELNNIPSRPIMPLPRRLPLPQRHQPFSRFAPVASLISPHSLEVSPTPIVDMQGGVTRNGERTSPAELLSYPPPVTTQPLLFSNPNSNIQRTPICPCCSRVLVCPQNHTTWTHEGFRFAERTRQLTPVNTVTGKRRRETDEDKENVGHQTARDEQRPKKKVQRKPIKSREIHRRRQVTPYADRQRRRVLESQGKIQRTLFRIPELIAQKKAAEAASLNGNNNNANYDEQSDEVAISIPVDTTATALSLSASNVHSSPPELQPSTPTRVGWSLGGLLGSVPRSISRFLPAFGAEPSQHERRDETSPSQSHRPVMHHENLSQNLSNETEQLGYASRTHENDDGHHNYESVSPSANAVGPSISEEWKDTPSALPEPVVSVPVRSLATQQQTQEEDDEEDLSYDLFPRNHRLSSYSREAALRQAEEDARQAREQVRIAQEAARQAQEEARLAKEEARQAQETVKLYQPTSSKPNANKVAKTTNGRPKRRKPIPNPPGCSYGMDLRYFGSTSSSEAESSDNERPEQPSASVRPGVLRTAAAADSQTPARGGLRQRKQVRFGPSPPDVPSKTRKRDLTASDVMEDIPESPSQITAAPATPSPQQVSTIPSPEDVEMTTPSPLVEGGSDNQPRGQSTYGFTYEELYGDDFFDDIDEDPVPSGAGDSSSSGIVPEVGVLPAPIPRGVLLGHSNGQVAAAPPSRPALATMPVPLFRPATIGARSVERQRSDMERFRPRLPSGLRTAERYSSSPVPASSPALQGVVGQGLVPHSFQWPRAAETGFSLQARPSNERLRMGFQQLMRQR